MELTILGSGTSVPQPDRLAPAYLVRQGETTLLVDCGSGSSTSLVRAGSDAGALSALALTHLHPDHTADLVPLLFSLANPLGPARSVDLPLYGPQGTAAQLEALRGIYGHWIQPRSSAVVLRELGDGQRFVCGALRVTAFAVAHGAGGLAYRLESGDGVLCLSGDSGPCLGLEQAARGADLLVCECAALEEEQAREHMSATAVGELAAAAGCQQVVLTHLYPHIVASEPLPRVRSHFGGPVQLAEDGLVLTL
jgi:ribonuclease BN (tRNA processing enzyme)